MPVAKIKLKNKKPAPAPVAPAGPPSVFAADGTIDAKSIGPAYQYAMDKANNANETRYQDILGQYGQRFDRNMGQLNNMGAQAQADINEGARAQANSTYARLADSGLAGTTIAPTMAAGVEKQRVAAMNRLDEQLRRERLQADSMLSKDKLDFMERRTDQAPDMGLYAQLAMQAAEGKPGAEMGAGPSGGAGGPPYAAVAQQMQGTPSVTEMKPGGWHAGTAGIAQHQTTRPLTPAEQAVVKMGGYVPGYNSGVGSQPKPMMATPKAAVKSPYAQAARARFTR